MPVVPADQVQPTWESFLSWDDDVKPWLQWSTVTAADDSVTDAKLRMVTDMACTWVQNYLGRPVAPTTFVRKFDGSAHTGSKLALPYYPILEIESVVETWGMNGSHVLVYQSADSQGGPGEQMYQVDWVRGILTRTYQGLIQRPWFPGTQNISVTWKAGFNPVPMDIKTAALEMVSYWWRNTQEAQRTFAKMNEYDVADNKGLWPGVPHRVTTLLQPYVQIGIG